MYLKNNSFKFESQDIVNIISTKTEGIQLYGGFKLDKFRPMTTRRFHYFHVPVKKTISALIKNISIEI